MKKTALICFSLILVIALLAGCGPMEKMLQDAAEQESYDFGADSLSSVKTVIGMREVTGFEKKAGTGYTLEIKKYEGTLTKY